jgi:hypothetical protein
VPDFSQIPALLAQTNLLSTTTPLVMDGVMERHGLVALQPTRPIFASSFSFIWGFRLENDLGSRWLRSQVMRVYADLSKSVAAEVAGWNVVQVCKPRKTRK